MTEYVTPSINTHVPLTGELPPEDHGQLVGRPDLPTPHLWQGKVKVKHKTTGKPAIVVRVDYGMMMFRAFYPSDNDGAGRFSERTEWEHCHAWDVEVTWSEAELERQAAARLLEEQISKLDAKQIALARVLCDDADPNKALAKLRLLIQGGLVKMPEEMAASMVEPVLPPEPVQRVRKKAEPKVEP
jgi:hypothetical protein